ncbi:lactate dehydrogenase-like 2-hydroxyacid dehydrogenase [Micromonospora pisi]|uniref:Lactate dehydrogenase-like 2-hydroxyacid dehydrogenase n=1 Tax=Micromonospora pisi TaxID=589240 RepID=A0A495JRG3_9ACTN|nr:D-2-hydroxyacid dehydrogenase family protein [Micromonospora pisi]RKR91108.1 lactate dehydrogenase-like 2-hydroxyacid dehydrogenase [Micromonospora pisi]
MAVQVVVLDDYQNAAREFGGWERLGERVELTVLTEHVDDPDVLVQRLAHAEVVVAMRERTPFPEAVLDRLPRLRLLVTTGMANVAIDVSAAKRRGVTVTGTRGVGTGTAELTWALILALVRQVPAESQRVRTGGWQSTIGGDLAGHTLGVVGLGRLGAQVATVGRAFGMQIVAWSQNLRPEHAAELGVRAVSKEELFADSDIVTVHLQLSDRTRGLIGEAELRSMRPDAYLVNTSRGPIIDEAALLTAVREGWIGGAGLDVFDVEPLPADHPLRTAPNTVLTPHLGYVTRETYRVFYGDAVEDIDAFLAGSPVRVL